MFETKGMNAYNLEVYLDYGQMTKLKDKKGYILDEQGNRMKFSSNIKALNFLEKNGFKLVTKSFNYNPFYSIILEKKKI